MIVPDEIKTLQAYQEELKQLHQERMKTVKMLQDFFLALVGDMTDQTVPADHVLYQALHQFEPFIVQEALFEIALKFSNGIYTFEDSDWFEDFDDELWSIDKACKAEDSPR